MKHYTVKNAEAKLDEVLALSQIEPVLLSRDGEETSVLLSQEAYQALTAANTATYDPIPLEHKNALRDVIQTSRQQIAAGDYTPMDLSLRQSMDAFKES